MTPDPLSHDPVTPYMVRSRPHVTWDSVTSEGKPELFTLMFYDAGYLSVKALFVNIPGNQLDLGEVDTFFFYFGHFGEKTSIYCSRSILE